MTPDRAVGAGGNACFRGVFGYTSLEQKIRECLNQEEDKIYF